MIGHLGFYHLFFFFDVLLGDEDLEAHIPARGWWQW